VVMNLPQAEALQRARHSSIANPKGNPPASATLQRVGLICNDGLRIAGLQALFAEHAGVEVVPLGSAAALASDAFSLVLLDSSSTGHFLDLIATFRRSRPAIKLIVLGEDSSFENIQEVIGAGAKGFLPQTATPQELSLALKIVQDGSIWAPRKVMAQLLEARSATRPPAGAPNGAQLTARESQIAELLVTGKSNREIGEQLGIDVGTVKAHLGRIMRKFGVVNRIELTMHLLNRDAETQ